MKKFVAIGHWEGNDNITSIASDAHTKQDFVHDLHGNGFIAWVVLTEKKYAECINAEDGMELFEIIKKLTTNYRRWNLICEYIEECADIINAKLEAI